MQSFLLVLSLPSVNLSTKNFLENNLFSSQTNYVYSSLTLAVGAGAKAEAEAKRAREAAAVNFMVTKQKLFKTIE